MTLGRTGPRGHVDTRSGSARRGQLPSAGGGELTARGEHVVAPRPAEEGREPLLGQDGAESVDAAGLWPHEGSALVRVPGDEVELDLVVETAEVKGELAR